MTFPADIAAGKPEALERMRAMFAHEPLVLALLARVRALTEEPAVIYERLRELEAERDEARSFSADVTAVLYTQSASPQWLVEYWERDSNGVLTYLAHKRYYSLNDALEAHRVAVAERARTEGE